MTGPARPDAAAGVEDVLITEELARRPYRAPDYEAENRALTRLAEELASHPDRLLQTLVELVVEVCRADSAGISIHVPGEDGADGIFRWDAVAGLFAPNLGGSMPRSQSPCGTVIDRNTALLFDRPHRHFAALAGVEPSIVENLLVPFHVDGQPTGTVWAIGHTPARRFDAEDARLLASLARFAAAGYQRTTALAATDAARADLEEQVADRTNALSSADAALHESEARFRAMFEQASIGIVEVTLDGRMQLPNPGFCAIIGYPPEEARHLRVRDVTHPEDYEAEAELTRRLLAGEIPSFTIEKRYVRKDGGLVWGQMSTSLVRQPPGEPLTALAVIEDITERKRAEEVLREREARYRTLVENLPDYAIFQLDPAGIITEWTPGAERVKGYTAEEVLAQHLALFFTPEEIAAGEPARELDEAARTGRAEREGWRVRKGGERFWVNEIATAIYDADGRLAGFTKISRDLTERRAAEEALRAAHDTFRHLVEHSPFGVYAVDADFRLVQVSAGAQKVFASVRPLLGRDFAEVLRILWPEPFATEAIGYFRHTLATGEPYHAPSTVERRRDIGEVESYDWKIERVTLPDGRFGVVCHFYDLSERQRYEAALRESEERYRLIVEGARDYAIFTLDAEGRIESWAPGAEAVFGWAAAEVLGQPSAITFTPEDRQSGVPEAELATARAAGMATDVRWYLRKDGGPVFIEGTTRALRDASGQVRGFLKIGQDVTERRRLEAEHERLAVAEAVATERQALLRRVVAAQEEERRRVAHEVHDSVTQLASAAALRLDDLADRLPKALPAEDMEDLDRARDLARRAAQEARRLIARLRPEALDDFGLTGAVCQEVAALRADGWQVSLEDGELVGVRLPPEAEITLYRVAQEALANVRKHTEPSRVAVELRRVDGGVRLRVQDWGPGFDVAGARADVAAGERVGLVGMRERLALLGGRLEVRSRRGRGTTLTAVLPLPEEP